MRILQICVLLLAANLLIPTVAIHFMDLSSDDLVCELIEDFGEEEEEDGESIKDAEDSVFFREWNSNGNVGLPSPLLSQSFYFENSSSIHAIDQEVQTPPPEHTMC